MTHHPATLHEAFASLRTALEAERETCAHMPAAVESMLLALLLRLLGGLERMALAWHASAARASYHTPLPAFLSRSHARIAAGLVPPRALRTGPIQYWLVRLHPNRGMRPIAAPPAPPRPPRPVRAPPPPIPA